MPSARSTVWGKAEREIVVPFKGDGGPVSVPGPWPFNDALNAEAVGSIGNYAASAFTWVLVPNPITGVLEKQTVGFDTTEIDVE